MFLELEKNKELFFFSFLFPSADDNRVKTALITRSW